MALRFGRSLAIITAVGAALRLTRLVVRWSSPLPFSDSIYYSAQARVLAYGRWFIGFNEKAAAEHGPVTTLLLALVSRFEPYVSWQRAATVATGVATVALVGLLGRRIGGERVGLVAASIAAVYPNMWLPDGLVMSESPALLLVVASLLGALTWREVPSKRAAIGWGVVLGLAMLTRSELALMAAALIVGAWFVRRRAPGPTTFTRVVLAAVACAATIAPWVIYNSVRFEEPVLLSTNDGGLLLGSNCDATYQQPDVGGWSLLCIWPLVDDSTGDESVKSRIYRRRAVDYISDHSSRLPVVVAYRGLRVLSLAKFEFLLAQDVGEDRERWAVIAGIPMFWALALLSVRGARRLPRYERFVLLVPIVLVFFVALASYGSQRLRAPAEPAIAVLAAVAITRRDIDPSQT